MVMYIPRLDAWIMTVLKYMMSDDTCGAQGKNIYVDNSQKSLPIDMGWISEEMYKF